MMRSGENTLFPLVHDYLKIYLPKQRNVSHNTVRSYSKLNSARYTVTDEEMLKKLTGLR